MRVWTLQLAAAALIAISAILPARSYALQAGDTPDALLDQAQATLVSETESGLALARRAEAAERASPQPRPDILLRAAWLEGEALFRLGRVDEAAIHLEDALNRTPPTNSDIYGKLLIASGRVARARGDNGLALKNFQDAFAVFSETQNRRYMAIALQSVGTLYTNARQYERAIEYDERAAAIYPDDAMIRIASLKNRGNAYRYLGRFDEARVMLTEALSTEAVQGIPSIAVRIYTNLAALEFDAGNMASAKRAVESIKRLIEENEAIRMPVVASAIEASILASEGGTQEAAALLDAAFEGVDLTQTSEDFKSAHERAYEVYSRADRPRAALAHLEAFKRLEDIERDIAASANLALMNAEFELSNKELTIANLRSERLEADVALIKARRQQEQGIAAAIILLAIAISAFFIWQTMQSSRVRRITERLNKELEGVNQKLRRSNIELEKANSAKTEFLATTSHEVRTPLNAVINLTAAVLDNNDLGPDAKKKLSTALKSAEHLHEIVSDVLDVARFEGKRVKAHVTEVDLPDTVVDVVNLWRPKAEEKGLTFETDIDIRCDRFQTDEKLLRQLLSNLLSNAIKFTSEGVVKMKVQGGIDMPLRIEISDTGIGIAKEDQKVIFESFRQVETGGTRSFGGTGLGLAICRQITGLLGGSITVESDAGEGSTFTVELPVQASVDTSASDKAPTAEELVDIDKTLSGLRVLAAEDNAVNAMVIQAILKTKVETLTIVENGLEAVNAVIDGDFDVVLMDKQMPVMDGVEAIRRIRSIGGAAANIPIIAVTADAFSAAREELIQAGADDYLSKPVKPDDLKRSIAQTLARQKKGTDAAASAK
ncbi:tetratricopeptide repeat-containing hybrid sensor histidine kinase/response regulator [Parvularcula lutaonensis]|uniref:histidine kinase n=1 Tax=Parvularcula lutaonensis TaxID=491923 RepID=A0ABV7M6W0_9PROT|nr:ATP-binding protein [Parvularcula lutaonensis]GGY56359.1 hypothetical protein GCM10007148_27390 [Parvularcula lutaonensis]